MKIIQSYMVRITDVSKEEMPKGAEILTVMVRNSSAYIWAIIDTKNELEERYFRLFKPRDSLPIDIKKSQYIGTFELPGKRFVNHLFEVKK